MTTERASYNGSIEASQASDVGSIPIARSNFALTSAATKNRHLWNALAIAQQPLAAFLTLSHSSFSVKICDFCVTIRGESQNAHAERLHWLTRSLP